MPACPGGWPTGGRTGVVRRHPNPACQCLGSALREPGYRPLPVESFSDPESHAGTVCKAANRTCAGDTNGFSQDHADYCLPDQRPEKLWLKPLAPNAWVLMCATQLPEDCASTEVAAVECAAR